jgi:hypothetical protein
MSSDLITVIVVFSIFAVVLVYMGIWLAIDRAKRGNIKAKAPDATVSRPNAGSEPKYDGFFGPEKKGVDIEHAHGVNHVSKKILLIMNYVRNASLGKSYLASSVVTRSMLT